MVGLNFKQTTTKIFLDFNDFLTLRNIDTPLPFFHKKTYSAYIEDYPFSLRLITVMSENSDQSTHTIVN